MQIDFFVRVSCMTYNQAPYIEDAMNGFCMQNTSFPFVCTIIDDASTDGEQEVIQHYLQEHFDLQDNSIVRNEETNDYVLTFARHKTNINCYFAVLFLKYNHYRKKPKAPYIQEWANTKYIAICEGDDYWIRPQKLQMQYNFLESNPDYSMCCHNAIVMDMSQERVRNFNSCPEGELSSSTIIQKWSAPTASLMYRKEFQTYPDWLVKIYSGDMALILRCMNGGRIYYFDKLMSVYRKNTSADSISSKMIGRELFVLEQHILLLDSFDKGTNYKFHRDIKKVIIEKSQIIKYAKSNKIKRLFEPYFYKLIVRRIKRKILA